jgi:outer membrane lipoprotein SlyB
MKRLEEDDEMMRHALSLGLSLMTLSACVSQSQWTPTVDTYGSSRAQYVTRDQQECRQLAMQTSGSSTGQAAQGAVVGGLLGAAAGAAIGAAAGGGAGRGAAIGAATGGIGAGAVRGVQSNQQFQRVFNQCMRNRGHNVLS